MNLLIIKQFLQKKMKHVDYIFAIKDKMGNLIAQNIPIHSGWAKEMAQ